MALLDFFKKREDVEKDTKTKQQTRRPNQRDFTDSYTVNGALTYGLYHNSYSGLKLAGGLAFAPIALPVFFMGFPGVETDDESLEEDIKALQERFITDMRMLHTESHRDGTTWVWPWFNSKRGRVEWEFIPDESITDIVRSLDGTEIIAVYTDESIKVATGRNKTQTIRRQREWTPERYTVSYPEGTVQGVAAEDQVNRFGIMPVPFANNRESNEVRGHSDYERIVPLLASYHEISLAEVQDVLKFRAKLVQKGVKNVDEWLANNGFDTLADVDVSLLDLVLNVGEEDTDILSGPTTTDGHREAKKMLFHQIVESSGVPEILWGLKSEGNMASVEENMTTLNMFVRDKQRMKNEPYTELWEATIRLELFATLDRRNPGQVVITWDNLDALSEKVKSEVFRNFAEGLSKLASDAITTPRQAFALWRAMYPNVAEETFEEFETGLAAMGAHNQWNTASWTETAGNKQ